MHHGGGRHEIWSRSVLEVSASEAKSLACCGQREAPDIFKERHSPPSEHLASTVLFRPRSYYLALLTTTMDSGAGFLAWLQHGWAVSC